MPVLVTAEKFLDESVTVTVAPWIGAICGSYMCPLMDPLMVCPYATKANESKKIIACAPRRTTL